MKTSTLRKYTDKIAELEYVLKKIQGSQKTTVDILSTHHHKGNELYWYKSVGIHPKHIAAAIEAQIKSYKQNLADQLVGPK